RSPMSLVITERNHDNALTHPAWPFPPLRSRRRIVTSRVSANTRAQPGLLLLLGGSEEPWLHTRTTASTGSSWPGSIRASRSTCPAPRSWRRRGDRVGVAEADRGLVAHPQGLQAHLVAAARGRRDRGLAGHCGDRRWVHRGVAARLAPGPAVPGGRLVAAGHRGMAGLPGDPGARLPRRP